MIKQLRNKLNINETQILDQLEQNSHKNEESSFMFEEINFPDDDENLTGGQANEFFKDHLIKFNISNFKIKSHEDVSLEFLGKLSEA